MQTRRMGALILLAKIASWFSNCSRKRLVVAPFDPTVLKQQTMSVNARGTRGRAAIVNLDDAIVETSSSPTSSDLLSVVFSIHRSVGLRFHKANLREAGICRDGWKTGSCKGGGSWRSSPSDRRSRLPQQQQIVLWRIWQDQAKATMQARRPSSRVLEAAQGQ